MKVRIILSVYFFILSFNYAEAYKIKPLYKKVADQWAAVPAGFLKVTSKDSTKICNGKTYTQFKQDSISIHKFWISKTEISNFEYMQFVESVKQSGDRDKLKKILPDTLVWRNKLSYNEPYVEYYFRHPAYREYPIVGITHAQALLYCEWLTEIYNQKFKELFSKITAKKIRVKLPTVDEWMWAARGGREVCIYPWAGPYLRRFTKGFEGNYQANFRKVGEESIAYDAATAQPVLKYFDGNYLMPEGLDDNASITAPVKSYWVNGYGIYNMAGNVAEMTATPGLAKGGSWYTCAYDLQIEARDPFEGDVSAKSYVGFRPIFVIVE